METNRTHVIKAADVLMQRAKQAPSVGIITGTGQSGSMPDFKTDCTVDYSQIPHFALSTVESHKGQVSLGTISEQPVMLMQGRFHLYEGYSPAQVTFPIRVMQQMGIKTLLLTNAAGGINLDFSSADIMMITDHINLTGKNPLTGPNDDQCGVRFPDMAQVYDPGLILKAQDAAQHLGIPIQKGVYAGLQGPSLETPAETRFLKTIGCDAVGFSTVMEAIAAVHAGMKILGLSLITNINNPDAPAATTLESVLETAQKAQSKFNQLVSEIVSRM